MFPLIVIEKNKIGEDTGIAEGCSSMTTITLLLQSQTYEWKTKQSLIPLPLSLGKM